MSKLLNNSIESGYCNGCELCVSICPRNAISMISDNEGFMYPYINSIMCRESCHQCSEICPVLNKVESMDRHSIIAFSGFFDDGEKLVRSASGGLITAISMKIISMNGIVFGVAYGTNFRYAEYRFTDNTNDLAHFIGSKYILSRKNCVYKKVYNALYKDKYVLFVGLPCEVAALKAYLNKEYEKLITCELLCHGPTSEKILQDFIDYLESKYGATLVDINLKYKGADLEKRHIYAKFDNGYVYLEPFYDTLFGKVFTFFVRPSCSNCCFKGDNRCADLTVGDYKGMSYNNPNYNSKGVSICLVNNLEKVWIIENLDGFNLSIADKDDIIKNSRSINSPFPVFSIRSAFALRYSQEGLEKACEILDIENLLR